MKPSSPENEDMRGLPRELGGLDQHGFAVGGETELTVENKSSIGVLAQELEVERLLDVGAET
jgi:hypothetical protein